MLAERPKPTTVFAVSLIMLFMSIGASAMLDWQIMSHSDYDLSYLVENTQYINYASWFAVNISMPGIAMSAVTCAFYWNSKRVRIMLPVAISACTAILLISGLEDCIYFFVGARGFPSSDLNWSWLLQSRLFGFWNTTIHIVWTVFWVFIAIPAVSLMFYRKTQRIALPYDEGSILEWDMKNDQDQYGSK